MKSNSVISSNIYDKQIWMIIESLFQNINKKDVSKKNFLR